MFRACVASGSRIAISSSSRPALIHTSASLRAENVRKRIARATKKENLEKKEELLQNASQSQPSPVLGTRPGDDEKWQNCDLKNVLVSEAELSPKQSYSLYETPVGALPLPPALNYGVSNETKKLLLHDLPALAAETDMMHIQYSEGSEEYKLAVSASASKELYKAEIFAKVLDLRNANAAGIAFENRRRIVASFSEQENPWDPGRPEVQAALLTYKIRNLWAHLTQFKRDVGNRRNLRKLVHQRAKILKYLKRKSRDRYDTVLQRLALEPESVEGELTV